MIPFARLFADELAFLREIGAEFAAANPALAPLLAEEGGDPDVHRLLQSFAFLHARLGQRLQAGLPDLMQDVLTALAPAFLRPIVPMTTVQWTPVPRALSRSEVIKSGTRVLSRLIEGTSCTFKTSYDVEISPIQLKAVKVDEGVRTSFLTLKFATLDGVAVGDLDLQRVRLHLTGAGRAGLASELLRRLLADVVDYKIIIGDQVAKLDKEKIQQVGYTSAETLLPVDVSADNVFRTLQEYLTFPQKFHYVDIYGLEFLRGKDGEEFELSFRFDRLLDDLPQLDPRNFLLHCTPAVNLFEAESDPITVDGSRSEYRLRVQGFTPGHTSISKVPEMWGWVRGDGRRIDFEEFTTFQHLSTQAGDQKPIFRPRRQTNTSSATSDVLVSFEFENPDPLLRGCVVTARLECSNGTLPGLLPPGGLDRSDTDTPNFATFKNIDAITRQIEPPLAAGLSPLLAILSGSAAPVTDLATLRRTISALEFRVGFDSIAERSLQLKMEALRDIRSTSFHWLVQGRPVRGQRITFDISEELLGGQGEAFFFGSVLNAFLGNRAPLNTCFQTEVHCLISGRIFHWPVHLGQKQTI